MSATEEIHRLEGLSDDGVRSTLKRSLTWKDAFWVASGSPAFVLFTLGAIAATVGQPAWIIWIASITIGFIQCFTYAEISGLFPHKSGGASIYGAIAWVRYSKFLAPVSVWCNWFAWSPVLALGTGLGASYVLSTLFPADAAINTWSFTLLKLDFIKEGLNLRINSTFILGAALLLLTFFVQHHGAERAAKLQKYMGITALVPLTVFGLEPLITGSVHMSNWFPLLPLAHDAKGNVVPGTWNTAGVTLMIGGLFVAGWSTYGFETAVCYTREFKNPKTDTFKAIFYSGLLCLAVYILVPLSFQGAMGLKGLLAPDIYDGTGVAAAMARIIGGGATIFYLIVVMLVFTLLLSVMTSMMGSSRTLYQASVDGWLPRYLSHVNEHGAPTRAMWTDLCFNLILLMMSDNVAVLAMSNVCYFGFVFLNLQAGWIHRLDRPNWARPFKCPNWLLALGALCGFIDLVCIGAGADIWGPGTLRNGLVAIALIIPVFIFRHYVQDKGRFPDAMLDDMELKSDDGATKRRAGLLPYLTLVVAVLVIWLSHHFAVFPA
ncbi:APC family permease [Paraburkholderia terrae]|uniref:APC family permease n=1 Tax=Paraburkholderia terrae TaxID=311230 RepID=A0A2I8ETR7_9BURK|nr:APC family permease [Paraburkholderia terrae]AUT63023.1 APC family permease [Paraburkholderia terrae]